ncbi:MAG: hypothetical protein KZQ96_23705 [Candidatus Thiodiazotropha sp. (ex Lucinoma borealis)]|nr:hypothetical protein [Candidatus Thiodiazotropha sp. (ex Lucinoma borealis)]
MDKEKIIAKITSRYPGKEIIIDPPGAVDPAEIIVELEPTSQHPGHSLALAVVGKSTPHYHKKTTEIYEAVEGIVKIDIEGKEVVLQPGEKVTINPKQLHHAEGNKAWFLTHSRPGWTFEDHIVWDSIVDAIEKSWSAQSSFLPNEWSNDNPARGQCAVTALIVQDELGGEIVKCDVFGDKDSHFFNKLSGGQIIDLTKRQFDNHAALKHKRVADREKILSHPGTQERYERLRAAVELSL